MGIGINVHCMSIVVEICNTMCKGNLLIYFKLFVAILILLHYGLLCSLNAGPRFCQNFIEVCALKAIDFTTRIYVHHA